MHQLTQLHVRALAFKMPLGIMTLFNETKILIYNSVGFLYECKDWFLKVYDEEKFFFLKYSTEKKSAN